MVKALAADVMFEGATRGLLGEFLQLLRRAGAPQWWDEYVDVASDDLRFHLSLESNATRIRMYAPGLVPALLQTEAYASAVVSRWKPDATAAEIARHVELRPRRQRRLEEPDACQLWAMVEESALLQHELHPRPGVIQVHQQVPGLLHHPGLDRMLRSTQNPHTAGAVLDHGKDVDLGAVEQVSGEEVQRQDPLCLGPQELTPSPARHGAVPGRSPQA
ncbi:MAG TPA: Scr1 family TA system antitoxin-like transcriptional regulator [Trebonia sp.]|nr:Scr1 family TA system antitoxin-like transcriptional regulator [Trebonia sp.]